MSGPGRSIEVRIEGSTEALDRFEAAWNHLEEGGQLAARRILALPDLPVTSLADELAAAFRKEGQSITWRENTHKMAEANKLFAHYAW